MKRCLCLFLIAALIFAACSCGAKDSAEGLGNGWEPERSMELEYAQEFAVDYYEGGYKLITLSSGDRFLTVPNGLDVPIGIAKDITVINQPVENIYLTATSAMCLFDALDALGSITLSGTKADGWYNENAKAAMEDGRIVYAGKYSEPDYELIVKSGCPLAVESTMIYHTPDVKEKLEDLGITVFVEQSSMESHPLGRTEWIKLYAALLDKEDEAEKVFDRQTAYLESAAESGSTGKTVAFFYISTSGYAVTRRSGDYVSKMIELAGGEYVFSDLGDPESSTSTVSMEMESFYAAAKDADVVIYNSTIGGELNSLEEFTSKSELLGDFKAVKENNVWCTGKNLFQETTDLGGMIAEMNDIMNGNADEDSLEFFFRLK